MVIVFVFVCPVQFCSVKFSSAQFNAIVHERTVVDGDDDDGGEFVRPIGLVGENEMDNNNNNTSKKRKSR